MTLTRRALLEGGAALSAQVLLSRRLHAFSAGEGSLQNRPAAQPGALFLTLTSLSANILRISISPANDAPRLTELGIVQGEGRTLAGPGEVHPGTVAWGNYSVKIGDNPLHVTAFEGGNLRQ